MAAFGINYTGADSGYVYYKRLETDKFNYFDTHELYTNISNKLTTGIQVNTDWMKISKYFLNIANKEYNKEIALLSNKFGVRIQQQYDLDSAENNLNTGKELIEAFNKILSTKKIFERNYKLITQTNGQKGLFTFFPTYFDKVINLPTTQVKIQKLAQTCIGNNMREKFANAIVLLMNDLVREALILMTSQTDAENGLNDTDRNNLRDAYKLIGDSLKDLNNQKGNQFIQSFIDTYNLNEIMTSVILANKPRTAQKNYLKNFTLKSKTNIHSTGGISMELLGDYLANLIGKNLASKNVKVESLHSGGAGIKPDFIVGVDLDTSEIQKFLEDNDFGTRTKNVTAMNSLMEQLNKFDDGYIIYSNAKNYTLNSDFHGFSAGEAINLNTLKSIMSVVGTKAPFLIFSILQLLTGAIGEDKADKVSLLLAKTIASALFDDYETIGEVNKNGINSIHLLYLNGVYFPISYYYILLSEAFRDAAVEEVNNIIKVNITYPKIAFNYDPGAENWIAGIAEWKQSHNENPWVYQRDMAYKQIRISYHFLRNFKSILSNLNITF